MSASIPAAVPASGPASRAPASPAPAAPAAGGDAAPFSGSYAPEDVVFLMKPLPCDAFAATGIAEKEALIQSGRRHYSEMISREAPPSRAYLDLFEAALADNLDRFAGDLARLARALAREAPGREIVLASLARAGTPVGILLRRALSALGRDVAHYSLSIIRDRGLDARAVEVLRRRHPDGHLVWVDGWTGKGAIARELKRSTAALAAERGWRLPDEMVVVADPAGVARLAASGGDYLIPSAILNATVSGLVSRSILNDAVVGPGDFHACLFYEEYRPIDLSRRFVDTVETAVRGRLADAAAAEWGTADRARLQAQLQAYLARMTGLARVTDPNRIKPGIGESTRAVLRRQPERLFVRDRGDPDLRHLMHLAAERAVPVEALADLPPPWRATAVIGSLGDQ